MTDLTTSETGVVIPIRTFRSGKTRLAGALGPADRERLLRAMAERVVHAAGSRPVAVVSGDAAVAAWARGLGVEVIEDPGALDAAVTAGFEHFTARGARRIAAVHADLPLVEHLDVLFRPGDAPMAVVVPDLRDDGTPALSLPARTGFRFAYGPGSFGRHLAEARRCGLEVIEEREDDRLRRDLDSPADLASLPELAT